MTFNELQDDVNKELKISGDQLTLEAIRTPDIFNKFNKMLFFEKKVFKTTGTIVGYFISETMGILSQKGPEVYEKKPLLKKIMDTDVKLYLLCKNYKNTGHK